MRVLQLDGAAWTTELEFYETLLGVLEPIDQHGMGVDAFVDSMIWGGMLQIKPPYRIEVFGVVDPVLRGEISMLAQALADARGERRRRTGTDCVVSLGLA